MFSVTLLNMLHLEFQNEIRNTPPRPYYALSLRRRGDTGIVFGDAVYHCGDHSLALFPPDQPYRRETVLDDMIVFHFTSSVPLKLPFLCEGFNYARLRSYFEDAYRAFCGGTACDLCEAQSILYRVLAELLRANEADVPPLQKKIAACFRQHFTDPDFTVSAAAGALYFSENYLRRLCQRYFQTSPSRYLFTLRMERARELLCSGYYSVHTAALMCGYRDAKNFSTAFRKHFGYTPSSLTE